MTAAIALPSDELLSSGSTMDDFNDLISSPAEPTGSSTGISSALNELEVEYATGAIEAIQEGASPPSQLARIYAAQFLRALAASNHPSDVYFDDAGEAVMEWHPGAGRVGVVRVNGLGRIRFAFVRPGGMNHGEEPWTGGVPGPIQIQIKRIVG